MVSDKWKQLTVKSESIKLADDLSITVKGLTFKEVGELSKYHDQKNYGGAMEYLLNVTLQKAPEIDDSEIAELVKDISSDIGFKIVQKVQELSGLDSKDVPKELSTN